jgi:hypothetical protein
MRRIAAEIHKAQEQPKNDDLMDGSEVSNNLEPPVIRERQGHDEAFFAIVESKICQPGITVRFQNGRLINESQDQTSADSREIVELLLQDRDIKKLYQILLGYFKHLIKFFIIESRAQTRTTSAIAFDQCQKFFTTIDIFPGLVSSLKLQELVSLFATPTKLSTLDDKQPNAADLLGPDQIVRLLIAISLEAGRKQGLPELNLIIHVAETIHFSKLMQKFQL